MPTPTLGAMPPSRLTAWNREEALIRICYGQPFFSVGTETYK